MFYKMNNKIAIIYTTFLRNELAFETIQAIQSQLSENCILLLGDQNQSEQRINHNPNWHYTFYYSLPYDCGLSYARNYLVQQVNVLNYKYCLITADSIEFTQLYNFQPIIEFMESDSKIVKVGFQLNNRIPWEYNLTLDKAFTLHISNEWLLLDNINYHKVDMCKNFFLAKTEALFEVPWDDDLKLGEHEDHCWRLKQAGYKTYHTNAISANYIKSDNPEYTAMRKRLYSEFIPKLCAKYNLQSWIHYDPDVIAEIRNQRKLCS